MNLGLFLSNEAKKRNYNYGEITDNFEFKIGDLFPRKTKGIVYGFVTKLNDIELEKLKNEAKKKKTLTESIDNIKPINNEYYVLYWGKSSDVFGRINAHYNGHKGGNSNLHLKEYKSLHEKKIIYGTIYIEKNKEFEEYLLVVYPPILKTKKIMEEE